MKQPGKLKRLFPLICFVLVCRSGFAQSNYSYDLKKDLVIGSLSLGVFITPFFFDNKPAAVPTSLHKGDVNGFDRYFMLPYNKGLDITSDISAYVLLALPALSVAAQIRDKDALLSYGIMYAEAFLLTYGTKEILKSAIIRYRPYMYDGGIPSGKGDDYYNSFPSGSAALAFMSAGFLSSTFSKEYPDSPWKLPLVFISYGLAAGIGAARIVSGSHFLSDVLTGAAIGSLYGYLIPFLHLKKKDSSVAFYPNPGGFMLSWSF